MSGDTEIFQQGELGEAPGGGSLTTYRELCSLATDLGQPDLLYKCAPAGRLHRRPSCQPQHAPCVCGTPQISSCPVSLSTLKELCSRATTLGQPSLLLQQCLA